LQSAVSQRDKAVRTYVTNDGAEDAFVIESYRKAEYSRINLSYDLKEKEISLALERDLRDLAAKNPSGKLELTAAQTQNVIEQVEEKKKAALQTRDGMKEQVDMVVSALYAAREKNKLNLAIATKLNAAIEQYEEAGVDMSVAQEGIDSIFAILEKYNLLSKDPKGAEVEAKKTAIGATDGK
jgi:tricorn protease-like protein